MKRGSLVLCVFGIMLVAALNVTGQGRPNALHTPLRGFEEVPAVSTGATGDFQARVNPTDAQLTYLLQYSDLVGTVTQAHIHFGARATNGGISIWLCGTASNPGPAGTPICPQSGTVIRTVTGADVIGPAGQGISPGEFAEVVRAMRSGAAYANVHTTAFPGGEIRGQIRGRIRPAP